MKRLLLTTAIMLLPVTALADVIVNNTGGSTGDLVNFQSVTPGSQVVGSFNGQHQGLVDFNCLGGCTGFTGASNGNDIKITSPGFTGLSVQVFNTLGTTVQATSEDIFSITGTGDVTVGVTADEAGGGTKLFTFDLQSLFGTLGPGQNFFTLTAINNEAIDKFTLLDTGGTITDFEHYRVEVAGPLAVPGPVAGAGWPGIAFAAMGLIWFQRNRKNRLGSMFGFTR